MKKKRSSIFVGKKGKDDVTGLTIHYARNGSVFVGGERGKGACVRRGMGAVPLQDTAKRGVDERTGLVRSATLQATSRAFCGG